jgi:hypothetical protein
MTWTAGNIAAKEQVYLLSGMEFHKGIPFKTLLASSISIRHASRLMLRAALAPSLRPDTLSVPE